MLALLRANASFARLWVSQAISATGDWVYTITAVGVVAQSTESSAALAVLLIVQLGPAAVVGLLGGPLIDRLPRRSLMIGADLARAVAVGSLLGSATPSSVHLWIVAAALGGFGALFGPSLQATLPTIVARDQLVAANAALNATFTFAVTVGPLAGGVALAQVGARPAFALNAASFVLSALVVAAAQLPRTAAAERGGQPLQELRAGFAHLAGSAFLRALLAVLALLMLGAAVKAPLEPLLVLDALDLGPDALGLVGMAWGVGMFAGAAAAPAAARRWKRTRLLTATIAAVGTCVVLAASADRLAMLLVLWLAAGAGNGLGMVAHETLLQESTPDALRGRLIAVSEAVMDGSYLLGAACGGLLGGLFGVRPALAVCGVLLLAAAALSALRLERGRHTRPVLAAALLSDHRSEAVPPDGP